MKNIQELDEIQVTDSPIVSRRKFLEIAYISGCLTLFAGGGFDFLGRLDAVSRKADFQYPRLYTEEQISVAQEVLKSQEKFVQQFGDQGVSTNKARAVITTNNDRLAKYNTVVDQVFFDSRI